MLLRNTLVVLSLILAPLPLLAHEEEPAAEEDPSPWSGKTAFGYLGTGGNTDNANLNALFEIGYAAGRWNHFLDAYAINASEDDDTTAEAYGVGWKSELNLSEHDYLFGRVNFRKDRFSGFPTQWSESIGYGRRIIDTAVHVLSAEIGAGARQSERADGVDENDFIVRAGLNYLWTFSETANFTQSIAIEYGDTNTYLESVSAVTARLVGSLALVASYTVKNNSDVLPGIEKTDTYSALTLEYAF